MGKGARGEGRVSKRSGADAGAEKGEGTSPWVWLQTAGCPRSEQEFVADGGERGCPDLPGDALLIASGYMKLALS